MKATAEALLFSQLLAASVTTVAAIQSIVKRSPTSVQAVQGPDSPDNQTGLCLDGCDERLTQQQLQKVRFMELMASNAYLAPGDEGFLKRIRNWHHYFSFDEGSLRGHIYHGYDKQQNRCLLTIAGTNDIADWIKVNLLAIVSTPVFSTPTSHNESGERIEVPVGILSYYFMVEHYITKYCAGKKVFATGHSLGGATAELAHALGDAYESFNFGGPKLITTTNGECPPVLPRGFSFFATVTDTEKFQIKVSDLVPAIPNGATENLVGSLTDETKVTHSTLHCAHKHVELIGRINNFVEYAADSMAFWRPGNSPNDVREIAKEKYALFAYKVIGEPDTPMLPFEAERDWLKGVTSTVVNVFTAKDIHSAYGSILKGIWDTYRKQNSPEGDTLPDDVSKYYNQVHEAVKKKQEKAKDYCGTLNEAACQVTWHADLAESTCSWHEGACHTVHRNFRTEGKYSWTSCTDVPCHTGKDLDLMSEWSDGENGCDAYGQNSPTATNGWCGEKAAVDTCEDAPQSSCCACGGGMATAYEQLGSHGACSAGLSQEPSRWCKEGVAIGICRNHCNAQIQCTHFAHDVINDRCCLYGKGVDDPGSFVFSKGGGDMEIKTTTDQLSYVCVEKYLNQTGCLREITASDSVVECEDGIMVADWRCTAAGHGPRIKCPPDFPKMCADTTCGDGVDNCCDVTCESYGGLLPCDQTNTNAL